jgi:hypothetical protein
MTDITMGVSEPYSDSSFNLTLLKMEIMKLLLLSTMFLVNQNMYDI